MAALVQRSDFVNNTEMHLPQNKFEMTAFDNHIQTVENQYLPQLLGVELYKLFIADCSGTPATPTSLIYQKLYNVIMLDDNGGVLMNEGMKKMLMRFIWSTFVPGLDMYASNVGMVSNATENAVNQLEAKGKQRILSVYYQASKDYEVIQKYIRLNSSDYPLYNGQKLIVNPIFV